MTATEDLRRLLDERGVEWGTGLGSIIEWAGENGRICRAFERNEPLTVDVEMLAVIPAQAVEATLGRGECHNVHEPPKNTEFWPCPHFKCSECGATHVSTEYVFYCPNCGRKVVEE